jgi:phospho-N-acetylmuramoyl-pentapeptide-transferase
MAVSLLFGVLSCLLALIAGHPFVRLLRLYRVGKAIQVELPSSHVAKAGTPTMGGLLVCATDGLSETQVAQRFWLVSILAAMLGVALALV